MPLPSRLERCEVRSWFDFPDVKARDFSNRLGDRIRENYNSSKNKTPGGACYDVCYTRVAEATRQVCGTPLPPIDRESTFGRLWGSFMTPLETWMKLPEQYRGKGAAGAMAWANLGFLIEGTDIWSGRLKPGAVIQTWRNRRDYERVRDGKLPSSYGHSFIFLSYVRNGRSIRGMKIADQGFQSSRTLKRGEYGYWVGANTLCP